MVAEKTIAEDKETLNRLLQNVKDLFITYKAAEQLIHTDISVIGRAKKNRRMKRPSLLWRMFWAVNDYLASWADIFTAWALIFRSKMSDRVLIDVTLWNVSLERMGRLTIHNQGGLLPFLLKRRIKIMVKDILSTCYLYIFFEKDSEKREIAQKIIDEIKKHQTSIITKTRESNTDKIKLSLELISPILGFVTVPFLVDGITKAFPPQNPFFDFVIWVIVAIVVLSLIYAVEFFLIWLFPKILWYRKVITICQVKTKEMSIYDDLLLLQKNVLLFPQFPDAYRRTDYTQD